MNTLIHQTNYATIEVKDEAIDVIEILYHDSEEQIQVIPIERDKVRELHDRLGEILNLKF
mgnify:CR=1 FL=1